MDREFTCCRDLEKHPDCDVTALVAEADALLQGVTPGPWEREMVQDGEMFPDGTGYAGDWGESDTIIHVDKQQDGLVTTVAEYTGRNANFVARSRELVPALIGMIRHYRQWIDDLQSGMYVNCVYCGHRYGPGETTPVSMADALKAHVEQCPAHPMSKLKQENEGLKADLKDGADALTAEIECNQLLRDSVNELLAENNALRKALSGDASDLLAQQRKRLTEETDRVLSENRRLQDLVAKCDRWLTAIAEDPSAAQEIVDKAIQEMGEKHQ